MIVKVQWARKGRIKALQGLCRMYTISAQNYLWKCVEIKAKHKSFQFQVEFGFGANKKSSHNRETERGGVSE